MRITFLQEIIDKIRNKKKLYHYLCNLELTKQDFENIDKYLEQKPSRKAKSVLYTCITNNYDDIEAIQTYKYVNNDWDYVCFTDNQEHINQGQIGIWEIRPLQFNELDNTRNNRWHKINPHLLFPEYDESIYIDANINIISPFLFKFIYKNKSDIILPKHFKRKCIYEEYEVVSQEKLDDSNLIEEELKVLKEANMPCKYGLCENNIIYRKHNKTNIKNLMDEWWNMVLNYSKRDQLSLMYILWKNGINIKQMTFDNSRVMKNDFYVFAHKKGREVNISLPVEQTTSPALEDKYQ